MVTGQSCHIMKIEMQGSLLARFHVVVVEVCKYTGVASARSGYGMRRLRTVMGRNGPLMVVAE